MYSFLLKVDIAIIHFLSRSDRAFRFFVMRVVRSMMVVVRVLAAEGVLEVFGETLVELISTRTRGKTETRVNVLAHGCDVAYCKVLEWRLLLTFRSLFDVARERPALYACGSM